MDCIKVNLSSRRNGRETVIYCRSMGMTHCFGAGYPKMLYEIGNIAHKTIAVSIVAIGILKSMLCVMKACSSANVSYICISAPMIHGQHAHIHMCSPKRMRSFQLNVIRTCFDGILQAPKCSADQTVFPHAGQMSYNHLAADTK